MRTTFTLTMLCLFCLFVCPVFSQVNNTSESNSFNNGFSVTNDVNLSVSSYVGNCFVGCCGQSTKLYSGVAYQHNMVIDDRITGIQEDDLPTQFSLKGNYPNPFNSNTTISFELPSSSHVYIDIYTITGQRVCTLFDGIKSAGSHAISWRPENISTGIYFTVMHADNKRLISKMLYVK